MKQYSEYMYPDGSGFVHGWTSSSFEGNHATLYFDAQGRLTDMEVFNRDGKAQAVPKREAIIRAAAQSYVNAVRKALSSRR